MNKARRHELKMLKYKKRLKNIKQLTCKKLTNPKGVENGIIYNLTSYKTSGKPCSCAVCSPYKYNRAKQKHEVRDIENKLSNREAK